MSSLRTLIAELPELGLIDCHQIAAMRRMLTVLDAILPAPYRIITPFPPHPPQAIKTGMRLMAHPGR
jgi:hypothetical protein